MRRQSERGSALILVVLVVLVLTGIAIVALRQTRSEQTTSGNLRVSRQAYQAAYSGLLRSSLTAMDAPQEFYRVTVQAWAAEYEDGNTSATGEYTFGEDADLEEPGIFQIDDPLDDDSSSESTGDGDRVGLLEYKVIASNPRLGEAPAGYTVAGPQAHRPVYYIYQFDAIGWVNREPGSESVAPGTGGAKKRIRADVRIGPITID